ncbi:MAG: hypothetical protein ACLQDY_14320 [Streptosporangiaceae bacterium]
MITSGIGGLRLPALDLGGPNSKPPPLTSLSWRVTRAVRAARSMVIQSRPGAAQDAANELTGLADRCRLAREPVRGQDGQPLNLHGLCPPAARRAAYR